jgi:hypothetical protein
MRVRANYTNVYDDENLEALAAYWGQKISRAFLRQVLTDVGQMGVAEQIAEGRRRLQGRVDLREEEARRTNDGK